MKNKLDNLLRFRDNEKSLIFTKILTFVVLAYALVSLVLVCVLPKDNTRLIVFLLLPLILLLSLFKKNDYLFLLAEFITIIADIFMILLKNIPVGFPIYLLVQLTYAVYFFLRDENKKRETIISIIRVSLMIVSTIVMILMKKTDIKFIVGGMYFVNILINIACAIIIKDPLLIIGFIVFVISDTFIGLSFIVKSTSSFGKILSSFNFVYFTYIFSQMILVMYKDKYPFIRKHENNN